MLPLQFHVDEQYVPPSGRHAYHPVTVVAVHRTPGVDVVDVRCDECEQRWTFNDFYQPRWEPL